MSTYPEKIPTQSFDSFLFSFSSASKVEKDVQQEFDAINQRIANIVDSEKFFVQDFPVLRNLMQLNPTKEDFKKLSKAFDRLGDLIEVFKELSSKLHVIQTLRENQTWFTTSFADFEKEIDRDLQEFLDSNPS